MTTSLRVLKSAGLLLGMQLVQRGLGIISTLILARLLLPEHFGVVALVVIALQFFELLVEIGNQQYIIQKADVTEADLNTAWSMDIVIKSGMFVLILLLAPSLADFFETPELTTALAVAAVTLPLRALKSPGMMLLAREINYRPIFKLTLWQKGLSFIVVIGWAFTSPSHWAIISGTVVSGLIFTIGSYRVHDFRPRWTIIHFRQQWQFSQWLLLRGIVGFTRSQIDNLMVSRLFGTAQLGGYNLVREVSLLPALSAIIPMSEPLLAAISESKADRQALAYRIRLSLALMITVLTPITAFIMLYPELIIRVLLGPDWAEFGPLLEPFGLFFFTFCLFALISDAIIAQGRVKLLFWFDVISTAIIVAVLWLTATGGLEIMAWARGWLAVATTFALLIILEQQTGFSSAKLLLLCIPTLAGTSLAILVVQSIDLSGSHFLVQFLSLGTMHVITAALSTGIIGLVMLRNTEEWGQLRFLANQARGK
ncbi:lipopolysaccharide biosynthesis protein [Marinobacter sp.]|uniref:lipopolysaccharide biosynthesis protein n=1 Tax=Marinobacter sp. TaxID=50741 RepID=UPI001B6BD738|nr:lipopolysaccharide biosynthesis protein [Marinobacter sp.]MBQ0834557.1 lipopolysaccharide biosynthesis protein [Marinobacter sp.]